MSVRTDEVTDTPPKCNCGLGAEAGSIGEHGAHCRYAFWRIAELELAERRQGALDKAIAELEARLSQAERVVNLVKRSAVIMQADDSIDSGAERLYVEIRRAVEALS